MLTADEVTTIFFLCDESSKSFDKVMNAHLYLFYFLPVFLILCAWTVGESHL
jgi:hypothetical protein